MMSLSNIYQLIQSGKLKRDEFIEMMEQREITIRKDTFAAAQPIDKETPVCDALGENTVTGRGFEIVNFQDRYGLACSLQQSSAIGDYEDALDRPGSSCVWLGVTDVEARILKSEAEELGIAVEGEVSGWMDYPIPEQVMLCGRMHLDRQQVSGLIARLKRWLKTGSFD